MNINDLGVNKMQASSREARSNQRRLLTAFGLENDSDLLKFNQLKVIFLILYEKKIITIPWSICWNFHMYEQIIVPWG